MQYTSEVLDRKTGELVTVDAGNYVTVTELGKTYGLGPRQTRALLQQIGLVAPVGSHGHLRLTREAINSGYGKHIKPKKGKGYAFDVLSPAGQDYVRERYAEATAQLAAKTASESGLTEARAALDWLRQERKARVSATGEVRFLAFYFRHLSAAQVTSLVGVSSRFVERTRETISKQLSEVRERSLRPLAGEGAPKAPNLSSCVDASQTA